jgi:HEAT repeat protein
LKGDAGWLEKQTACRVLRQKGTVASIPVLAGLLPDPEMSQFARYALEPMPYPEAGQAMVEALAKTNGVTRVGIINSLGVRREAAAVPALESLLQGDDPAAAGAAAIALVSIGTRESVRPVIQLARAGSPAGAGLEVAEALLDAAANAAERGRTDMARRLLESLHGAAWPEHIRHAAQAGLERLA